MELLVATKDKHPFDRRFYVRGDVIVAMPDHHTWGREERQHTDWVIVRVKGLGADEASTITARQKHMTEDPTEPLGYRAFGLDFNALSALDLSKPLTLTQFRAAIVARGRLVRR